MRALIILGRRLATCYPAAISNPARVLSVTRPPGNESVMDNKRRLIKAYKETPRTMGVYCIRNLRNGRRFVAASRDVVARMNRHRFDLKQRAERASRLLQADWDEFGPDAFDFSVLDTLEPSDNAPGKDSDPTEDLEVLEQLWLDKLQPYAPDGYCADNRR